MKTINYFCNLITGGLPSSNSPQKVQGLALLALLVTLLCASAFAEKFSAAVYMSGEEPAGAVGSHKVLGSELAKAITGSGLYTAVDRTEAILEQIDKEQAYQRSGAVDDRQIKALGVQLGVRYLCVASVSEVAGGKFLVEARFVDVETAEVIKIASESSAGSRGLPQAARRVAGTLIPGAAAAISAPRFYAEAGAGYHMTVGGYDMTGVNGWIGATGFVRADRFHRIGMAAGLSGSQTAGSFDIPDVAFFDVTNTAVEGFLSAIYRMGHRTRYADFSFSASLSLFNEIRRDEHYIGGTDGADDFIYEKYYPGAALGFSGVLSGRYDYIGGGAGLAMSPGKTSGNTVTAHVSGYLPVRKKIDVIPTVIMFFGEETLIGFSAAGQLSF